MSFKEALDRLEKMNKQIATENDGVESEAGTAGMVSDLTASIKDKAMKKVQNLMRKYHAGMATAPHKKPSYKDAGIKGGAQGVLNQKSEISKDSNETYPTGKKVPHPPKTGRYPKVKEQKVSPKKKKKSSQKRPSEKKRSPLDKAVEKMRDMATNFEKAKPKKLSPQKQDLASQNIREHMHHVEKHPGGKKQAIAIGMEQARRGKRE